MSVTDIKSAPPSPKGMQATASITFANENVIAIGISEAVHKLYLEGTYVGKAFVEEPIGLPQMTSGKQTITFLLEKADFVKQLAAGSSKKSVSYRLVSELRTVSGEDKVEINTSNTGALDLSALVTSK